MLKQILAASALIVIGAVSIHSAGAAEASKLRQLVVEPAGAPSPEVSKTEVAPFVLKPSQGIPSPTQTAELGDDAGKATGKVFPLIADPSQGIATPAATEKADAIASDEPAAAAPPAALSGPAGPIATGIQSQKGLYLLLTGRGYGVEILKHTDNGNVVFSVTVPGHPGEVYLLLVDQYGKVIERRHIDTAKSYSKAYGRTVAYAPTYAAADDNCNDNAGH